MEHCDGGDLQKLVKRCKKNGESIGEDFVWKVLWQTVAALFHCHRRTDTAHIDDGNERRHTKDSGGENKLVQSEGSKPQKSCIETLNLATYFLILTATSS